MGGVWVGSSMATVLEWCVMEGGGGGIELGPVRVEAEATALSARLMGRFRCMRGSLGKCMRGSLVCDAPSTRSTRPARRRWPRALPIAARRLEPTHTSLGLQRRGAPGRGEGRGWGRGGEGGGRGRGRVRGGGEGEDESEGWVSNEPRVELQHESVSTPRDATQEGRRGRRWRVSCSQLASRLASHPPGRSQAAITGC